MENSLHATKELLELSSDGVFRMSKIDWWLLKYEKHYKNQKKINSSKYLYEIEGEIVRLPDNIGNPSIEEKFIDVYDKLNELTQLHRNENYFIQEMTFYKDIKRESSKVNLWIKKNEKLGAEDYACFLIDYLDYDQNNNEYHLKVFFTEDKDLTVFVDREDFKYTIGFLEVFNEFYWI